MIKLKNAKHISKYYKSFGKVNIENKLQYYKQEIM
jgi:hypothetical protein